MIRNWLPFVLRRDAVETIRNHFFQKGKKRSEAMIATDNNFKIDILDARFKSTIIEVMGVINGDDSIFVSMEDMNGSNKVDRDRYNVDSRPTRHTANCRCKKQGRSIPSSTDNQLIAHCSPPRAGHDNIWFFCFNSRNDQFATIDQKFCNSSTNDE